MWSGRAATFIASPSSTLDASKTPSPCSTPSSSYKVPEDTVPECALKDVAEGLGSERVTKYFFRKRLQVFILIAVLVT